MFDDCLMWLSRIIWIQDMLGGDIKAGRGFVVVGKRVCSCCGSLFSRICNPSRLGHRPDLESSSVLQTSLHSASFVILLLLIRAQ